ncbi:MAG: VanZ family protein, partial [Opitutales bacterium]|nr:VanZ family protein [Opitutales bacterium]
IGAIVLTLLYGVVDEWIQYYNPLRSFDAWAWIADLAGSIAAIWVYRNWRLYRWVLETRVFDLCRLKLT